MSENNSNKDVKNGVTNIVDSLMKGMSNVLTTKTVVGEATTIGDTIILPLVDITFGIGAGGSCNDKKDGGGGGIGGKMSPSAVLIVHNGSTKLVNIKNQDAVTKIIDMVPDIIDKFTTKKEVELDDDEAIELAFPEEEK